MANDEADVNVTVNPKEDWVTQEAQVTEGVQKHLGTQKLDSVLNMAGNWIKTKNMISFKSMCNEFLSIRLLFVPIFLRSQFFFKRWLGWRFRQF